MHEADLRRQQPPPRRSTARQPGRIARYAAAPDPLGRTRPPARKGLVRWDSDRQRTRLPPHGRTQYFLQQRMQSLAMAPILPTCLSLSTDRKSDLWVQGDHLNQRFRTLTRCLRCHSRRQVWSLKDVSKNGGLLLVSSSSTLGRMQLTWANLADPSTWANEWNRF